MIKPCPFCGCMPTTKVSDIHHTASIFCTCHAKPSITISIKYNIIIDGAEPMKREDADKAKATAERLWNSRV